LAKPIGVFVLQEGRLVFATTNHREKLDEALIREGRLDRHFEFKNGDAYQVSCLFKRIYGQFKDTPHPGAHSDSLEAEAAEFVGILTDSMPPQPAEGATPGGGGGDGAAANAAAAKGATSTAAAAADGGEAKCSFSLAQIQGYLLTKIREEDPVRFALDGAAEYFCKKTKTKGGRVLEPAALTRQVSEGRQLRQNLEDQALATVATPLLSTLQKVRTRANKSKDRDEAKDKDKGEEQHSNSGGGSGADSGAGDIGIRRRSTRKKPATASKSK
jgi:hypothetical protein